MSLSLKETEEFIENKLRIRDWKNQLEVSKSDFLFLLERRFKQTLIYENISWGLKDVKDMAEPSVEEVIDQCQVRGSGACLQLNWYLYLLLRNLGYDVFVTGCELDFADDPETHCAIIAKIPATDSQAGSPLGATFIGYTLYLVDVGFARPAPDVINLNELPHSFIAGGFTVTHKFNAEKNRIDRFQRGGDPLRGKFKEDTEIWDGSFDLTPRAFEHFLPVMTKIFTKPDYCFFLNTFFMFRQTSVSNAAHFSYVSVIGRTLITGNAQSLETQRFATYEELIPHVDANFPEIGLERIKTVVGIYTERQKSYKARTNID